MFTGHRLCARRHPRLQGHNREQKRLLEASLSALYSSKPSPELRGSTEGLQGEPGWNFSLHASNAGPGKPLLMACVLLLTHSASLVLRPESSKSRTGQGSAVIAAGKDDQQVASHWSVEEAGENPRKTDVVSHCSVVWAIQHGSKQPNTQQGPLWACSHP